MTILDNILADKAIEVANRKAIRTIDDLCKQPAFARPTHSLKTNLLASNSGIIAEFKRKSPSKGWIHAEADLVGITSGYDQAGACGISILTDEKYFGGTPADVITARQQVTCPILRKEFVIDEYQIYEAKAMGADLILLIAAALTVQQTKDFARKAHELGLEVLLEVHNEKELGHANQFVDMLGVNNRNLKTFVTDIDVSFQLVDKIPAEFVKVSESGISNPQTVIDLRQAGYRGFLMGENFMKEKNPAEALKRFIRSLPPTPSSRGGV
ncbi:MAG: indole-3-glycerol phosphate synthase TrpC [Paludibacteraceae bacterium]|nr:indole-3-glycerol phosphate synthase TrpC [Paludibacteraceae bacterium]